MQSIDPLVDSPGRQPRNRLGRDLGPVGMNAELVGRPIAIEALGNKEITVVMDRGYNDYALFMCLTRRGTKFVTRIKENAKTTQIMIVGLNF